MKRGKATYSVVPIIQHFTDVQRQAWNDILKLQQEIGNLDEEARRERRGRRPARLRGISLLGHASMPDRLIRRFSA